MGYMNGEELEETLIFQDFITLQLFQKLGWSVNQLASKKYNIEYGESLAGIEIKNDKRMKETGNIYVELAESHYEQNFVPSGINRDDNTLIWCIGDFDVAYLIVKKQLKFLCDNFQRYGFKKVQTDTSIGILIPTSFLDKNDIYVLKKLDFKGGGNDLQDKDTDEASSV